MGEFPSSSGVKEKKKSHLDHCLFPVKVIDESVDVPRERERKKITL